MELSWSPTQTVGTPSKGDTSVARWPLINASVGGGKAEEAENRPYRSQGQRDWNSKMLGCGFV